MNNKNLLQELQDLRSALQEAGVLEGEEGSLDSPADGVRAMKRAVLAALDQRRPASQAADKSQSHQWLVVEQYRLIFKATKDIVYDWDLGSDILSWNEAVEEVVGKRRHDLDGTIAGWEQHIHPDDRLRVQESIRQALISGQEKWRGVYRFGPVGGPYRFFLERGLIIRNSEGEAVRMLGSMLDVTEQQRAEEALRQSKEWFSAMANNIPQLAWMAHEDGKAFWFNKRCYDFFGLTREEMLEKKYYGGIHPQYTSQVRESYRRAIKQEEPWEGTFPLRGKDGNYRWFLSRAVPIRDEQGGLRMWFGTNTDITNMLDIQEVLRKERAQLRAIMDNAPLLIVIKDLDGRMILANNAVFQNLDVGSPEQFIGRTMFQVFPERVAERLWKSDQEVLRSKEPITLEEEVVNRDGCVHTYLTTKFPVRDLETTETYGVCNISVDISGQVEMQQRERRYIGTLAHNLRVPATLIKGYLELLLEQLRRGGYPLENIQSTQGALQRALYRMSSMVDDFHMVTLIEEGTVELQPTTIHLRPFISGVLEQHDGLERERIGVELPGELPAVMVDPESLRTVLINLLDNAQKFSDRDKPIRIGAVKTGEEITISISDWGIGLSAEEQMLLFGKFFRAEKVRKAEGTGLGLYIVKLLVEANGGRVWVKSAPGEGSTFSFSLPAAL